MKEVICNVCGDPSAFPQLHTEPWTCSSCQRTSASPVDTYKPCTVEHHARHIVDRKMLTALNDEDKVAVLMDEDDLDFVIGIFERTTVTPETRHKVLEMLQDLRQLRLAAFDK